MASLIIGHDIVNDARGVYCHLRATQQLLGHILAVLQTSHQRRAGGEDRGGFGHDREVRHRPR